MSKFKGTRIAILVVLALVMSVIGAGAAGGPPGAGFYSGQTVQNLGPATDVMVTLYDMNNAANQPSRTWSVPEGGAFTFFLSDIPGTTAGFVGSAVVSSEQEVKAVVNVTNRKSGDFGIDGGTAAAQYRGISDASTGTTLVFPLAKAAFGPKTTAFYIPLVEEQLRGGVDVDDRSAAFNNNHGIPGSLHEGLEVRLGPFHVLQGVPVVTSQFLKLGTLEHRRLEG